jgi:hypothetical protein
MPASATPYTITYSYPGDTTYLPINNTSTALTIAQAKPVVTWAHAPNTVYGTALTQGAPGSGAQLDATANVPGTFVYSPPAGTILSAGNNQKLYVTFTPSDTTDYTGASGSSIVNITKATPVLASGPAVTIVYATTLSTSQLDVTASAIVGGIVINNLPGTFSFSANAVRDLHVGNNQPLSVTFTPADSTDYATATGTQYLNVTPATPVISWGPLAGIVYGTKLGYKQLDATANTPGTFSYILNPAGTVLNAGNNQTLSVTFTPTDTTDYTTATATASINVAQAKPLITWPNPKAIAYGTPLSGTQLDATANTAGTFSYSLNPAGTILPVGPGQTLSVTFTPTDATDYTPANATAAINVTQAKPVITWANPAEIVYGTALTQGAPGSGAQLDATANTPGAFSYSLNPAGTVLNVGSGQTLSATFTPTDSTDYEVVNATATISVKAETPVIIWPNPAAIFYPTPLSSTQLDAAATATVGGTSIPVAGAFVYTPAAGTVLNLGNQNLSVTFTPASANFRAVAGHATITVAKLPPLE